MANKKNETDKKTTVERNEKGQFVKGRGKTGGRQVGTKNKYGNIRDRLKDIIMPYFDYDPEDKNDKQKCFATDLMSIADPKDRIDAISKLMPYISPKFSSVTIGADADRPVSEEQRLIELDGKYSKKEVAISVKALTIVDNDIPSDDYDPDDDPNFNLEELEDSL